MFGKVRKLYFVGIGGSGMSGIAEILHNLGFHIEGSDCAPGEITDYLHGLGMTVHGEHNPDNLGDADVVVISSAVGEDNPEVTAARRRGIPVIKRAEMLGELMRLKYSIGVAGTHGKTTVTSMIGRILQRAELQPTLIVGGIVAELGTGAALGKGDYLVAEADEFDRSFLSMFPTLAVVTNIEPDHLDCYNGMDDLMQSFLSYMNRVPFYGSIVVSGDDARLAELRPQLTRRHATFGFGSDCDYRAVDVRLEPGRSAFGVYHYEDLLGEILLRVPGRHNVANALAAVAVGHELDVDFLTIADALREFTGVTRRFEILGEYGGIMVVDDYAHHPTEIVSTLQTARDVYGRRVIVIYQPHLYSRTRDFVNEFADALSLADVCLLTDIYPAREKPIEGVTSELIVRHARESGKDNFVYVGPKENAPGEVAAIAKPGDIVIVMGAGSITRIRSDVIRALKEK
ncbi:MAG: UDP-N-acetylmuramate--L-alanine ligase [Candidatus Zixiibacteriota bacterium]